MSTYIENDAFVYRLAVDASEVLEGVHNMGLLCGRIPRDASDVLAWEWITRVLERYRPDGGLLSEETVNNHERLDSKRMWAIDPPGGTCELVSGYQNWAVHVALVEDGQPTHTVVGLPDHDQVFHTGGAKAAQGPRAGRIAVSRTRPPAAARYVASRLGMELIGMGFADAKAIRVLLGGFDTYIHDGGQYEQSSVTLVGAARSTELFANRLDGSTSTYSSVDTFLPDMLSCRPGLLEEILAAVKEFKDQEQKQVSWGGYDQLR